MTSSRMIGDMSMPPRSGMKRRIGRNAGSVMRNSEISDRHHELIARIDDVECVEPGKDCRCDDQPPVDIERQNEVWIRASMPVSYRIPRDVAIARHRGDAMAGNGYISRNS